MPRFSIVIPTRQRADALRFAIETALAQTHSDFEVVVQNNGNDEATNEVVASFASTRIVLNGSADILPMSENWEAALTASRGEYVAFIGDDDGIMPDACAICDAVMPSRPSLGALHWTPHYYDWPTSLRAVARNRLVVNLPGPVAGTICNCRDLLRQLYDGTLGWTGIPLIYNGSFVRRAVIEKVRAVCNGRYFAGPIPDVHSGIANLWAMEQFLHIDRPLSICGASGHSNGNAHFVGGGGEQLQRRFHAENPELHQKLAQYFLDTSNMELTVASALVLAKEMFFPHDPDIALNMRAVLLQMGLGANRDPDLYEQTLDEMRQVARKYNIDTSDFDIPPKRQTPDVPFQGPVTDASGRTSCVVVNGAKAGLATIADAVRLAASMLPSLSPDQLNALVPRLETQRYIVPGRTISLSLCRIPATPRDRPLALFVPDMLTQLPSAAARAMPFLSLFDLAVCELPGHGASGEVQNPSLPAITAEYAALVDHILPAGRTLFAIGESLGGLVALALARLRPERVRNVIMIDTPFHLTRPPLAAYMARAWHDAGMSPYLRRMLREVMGFDPEGLRLERERQHFGLLKDAPFNCALIPGGDGAQHDLPSVLPDEDLAALRAISPSLLMTPRIAQAGHRILQEDPETMMTELTRLLVRG